MNEELKPCPFCGKPPLFRESVTYPNGEKSPAYIRCRRCGISFASTDGNEKVISDWNTRSVELALDQSHLTVTLRGGIEVWGVEFVQELEKLLDTLSWFDRVGKSVTDNYIHIHMQTKTVEYPAKDGQP